MVGARLGAVVLVVVLAACGSDKPAGKSVCDNATVPVPPACMTMCDPTPNAPTTCPGGYHCTPDGFCDAFCTPGGGECGDGNRCTPDGQCEGNNDCIDLECKVKKCEQMGMPPTTISGTVFAPNGTLPLYGINVYVPNTPVAAPADGAICDKCGEELPGFPVAKTTTDEMGRFTLTDVPSGSNIPLIISSGKWRRTLAIPTVADCTDTPLAANDTRLPKNHTEGYMPKIAISTGGADALECLIRKLGIDDAEMGTAGGAQKLHLYTDAGAGGGQGAAKFKTGFPGGSGNFADSTSLWGDVDKLKDYDIVILSCEGGQFPDTKPQAAMDAVKAYADLGGRVFASHWHNVWIEGATQAGNNGQKPAVWPQVAQWNNSSTTFTTPSDQIDEANNPKGMAFAAWMLNVGGSPSGMRDVIPIGQNTGKNTVKSVDNARAERWVYWPQGGQELPQMFQFTTPNEAAQGDRCGKVVFSDMHVSGDSSSTPSSAFPDSCASSSLTPQEKALAFMFFDIASCVAGPIF